MFFYRAYGLNIHSNLQLPELIPCKGKADVLIDFGKVKFSSTDFFTNGTKYKLGTDEIYLSWSDVANFKINNGRKITVDPVSNVDESVLREVVLGPVFAILLYQMGYLVLHASAVNIDGSAVAFMGWAGSGKSTTSMAVCTQGHNLITDDILSISTDNIPTAYPSFPVIKLESNGFAAQYGYDSINEDSNSEKSFYCLKKEFSTAPATLKTVYVLKKGDQIGIEHLKQQGALKELISHSYCLQLFQSREKSVNLIQCADIMKNVEVKILKVGRSLEELPEIIKLVENDVMETK